MDPEEAAKDTEEAAKDTEEAEKGPGGAAAAMPDAADTDTAQACEKAAVEKAADEKAQKSEGFFTRVEREKKLNAAVCAAKEHYFDEAFQCSDCQRMKKTDAAGQDYCPAHREKVQALVDTLLAFAK
jgi:hypothetical protein